MENLDTIKSEVADRDQINKYSGLDWSVLCRVLVDISDLQIGHINLPVNKSSIIYL